MQNSWGIETLRRCGFFDERWYLERYPDVAECAIDPVRHYVDIGAALGRDPSPYFSTSRYVSTNPDLSPGENPLWHYIHCGRADKRRVGPSKFSDRASPANALGRQPPQKLEAKLWAGFSEEVLPLLKATVLSPHQTDKQRGNAAWALARWYAFRKDHTHALKYLIQRRAIDSNAKNVKSQLLLETDCMNRLGLELEAFEMLDKALRKLRYDPDLLLAQNNTYASAGDDPDGGERLALINRIFKREGLLQIEKRNGTEPLTIFNIACVGANREVNSSGAKVSVLMPVYNAAEQIELAIRSLQQQTWRNLEILVADDCSTDQTREVVQALAAEDPRIVLVSMPENGGAYAARNGALARATGDFITVHDGDDWSHAQKIELQVKDLLTNEPLVANVTDWARAREDLYFAGTFRAHGSLISENTSSLMFRRQVVDALGGWDLARTSADTEYLLRIRAYFGEEAVGRLHRGLPLAFALDQETSLTRTPATHAKTLFYGARREYREAAQAWHAKADPSELKFPLESPRRPFPIPAVMQVKRGQPRHYDLIVISDFNLSGGAYISTMNYVNAALSLGKTVALFHWRRCDLDVRVRLRSELREQAMEGRFDILTAGDQVQAEQVLVGYPVVLNYKLDALPEIKTERFAILVNQMAARLTTGGDSQYDPRRITANVQALFGLDPVWVPISGYVQKLMREDIRYPEPHEDIWNPLLEVEAWCKFRVQWRGSERPIPVVGRHSRDHYTKWPSEAAALEAAYCVNQQCEVRLLGGAGHALEVLGYQPDNWQVQNYADTTHDFLQELDFFIHFPHEEYIEEFGRAVLEAMGLGIPVILPPVFEHTFGDYAHYAEPEEVWPLVEKLWADRSAYEAAAERALRFVQDKAAYEVLAGRLERLESL